MTDKSAQPPKQGAQVLHSESIFLPLSLHMSECFPLTASFLKQNHRNILDLQSDSLEPNPTLTPTSSALKTPPLAQGGHGGVVRQSHLKYTQHLKSCLLNDLLNNLT